MNWFQIQSDVVIHIDPNDIVWFPESLCLPGGERVYEIKVVPVKEAEITHAAPPPQEIKTGAQHLYVSDAESELWYKQRLKDYKQLGRLPKREEDEAAARVAKVHRDKVRELCRAYLPKEAQTAGRRPRRK